MSLIARSSCGLMLILISVSQDRNQLLVRRENRRAYSAARIGHLTPGPRTCSSALHWPHRSKASHQQLNSFAGDGFVLAACTVSSTQLCCVEDQGWIKLNSNCPVHNSNLGQSGSWISATKGYSSATAVRSDPFSIIIELAAESQILTNYSSRSHWPGQCCSD